MPMMNPPQPDDMPVLPSGDQTTPSGEVAQPTSTATTQSPVHSQQQPPPLVDHSQSAPPDTE